MAGPNNGFKFESSAFKREPSVAIKSEPGVFIKSEFGRSLASIPAAPSAAPKKDKAEDKKSTLAALPEYPGPSGRPPRRWHGGGHLNYRASGYHVRAHYGNGKVNFSIRKDGPKSGTFDWRQAEKEIFRKLHRAFFHIEPIERPGDFLLAFCESPVAVMLRFSVQVRRVKPLTGVPAPSGQVRPVKGEVEDDIKEMKDQKDLKDDKDGNVFDPHFTFPNDSRGFIPEACLPPVLPEVLSWKVQLESGQTVSNFHRKPASSA